LSHLKDHVELNKCKFRATASSASMIVVFLSYSNNNFVAIFFALAETLSTVAGTGCSTLLVLSQKK